MLRYLLRPFAFLWIRHTGTLLHWLNWGLPAIFATVIVVLLAWLVPSVNLFSNDGLFVRILGFVQSLPGFYIAALAAIATFNQPALDVLMPGKPPTASIVYNGRKVKVELTRRRFLCLLFSYLTAISFVLTFGLVAATTLSGPLMAALSEIKEPPYLGISRWAMGWLLFAALTQMMTITFYGLFYLGERMHTSDT